MNSRQKRAIKKLAKNRIGLVVILVVAAVYIASQLFGSGGSKISPNANAELHFIDVGQGDASLIITDEVVVLVDCGPYSASDKLVDYISAYTDKIDCLVFSHAHEDHMGGASAVIEAFDVKEVLMTEYASDAAFFERTLEAMERRDVIVTEAVCKEYVFGDVKLEVLSPSKDYQDLNNNSIVMRAEVDGGSVLFTGDAEREVEEDLLAKSAGKLSADVLKVGHHGSSSSTCRAFFKAVSPEFAVISCEQGNSYGHPHRETLELLEQSSAVTYRTDLQGSVVLEYTDGEIRLKP